METVSILIATCALAAVCVTKPEDGGEESETLPNIMSRMALDDDLPVPVLAVRARSAKLAPHLAGAKLRVCVKHGKAGHSSSWTPYVKANLTERPAKVAFARMPLEGVALAAATADFGSTTCLFLGRPGKETVLRLRLQQSNHVRSIAKAGLRLPAHWTGVQETPLSLVGTRASDGDSLGTLAVSVELRHVPKGRLRQYLQLLDAKEQRGAFTTGAVSVAYGTCADEAEADAELQHGRPIAMDVGSARRRPSVEAGIVRGRIVRVF